MSIPFLLPDGKNHQTYECWASEMGVGALVMLRAL